MPPLQTKPVSPDPGFTGSPSSVRTQEVSFSSNFAVSPDAAVSRVVMDDAMPPSVAPIESMIVMSI